MGDDPWSRATFAGTEQAQADLVADLTPDERIALLEQLVDLAEASGALQRVRADKQRRLDRTWASTSPPRPGLGPTGSQPPDDEICLRLDRAQP